jgi:PST family polysaccharide transporter
VLADSVLLAKGRVDLQMRWNVLQGVSVLGGILVGLRWGLVGVAVAYAVVVLALAYPWLRLATGLLRLPLIHVTRGLLRPLLATAVMVVSVTGARAWLLAGQRPVAELVLATVIGAGAYLGAILWIGERRVLVVARDLFAR